MINDNFDEIKLRNARGNRVSHLFRAVRKTAIFGLILFAVSASAIFGQTKKPAAKTAAPKATAANLPKVTQIGSEELKNILKPNGKPLLVNFWATWCGPCREEFPDLVKISNDYKDKIDVKTVSLDELSEIDGDVPKFLAQTKAEMPSYLLKVPDEDATIAGVSKNWQGGLPFTILYDERGAVIYSEQKKFNPDFLRGQIDKILAEQPAKTASSAIVELPKNALDADLTYEKGQTEAKKDVARGKLIIKRYGFGPSPHPDKLLEKYGIELNEYGCLISANLIAYVKGYNEISLAEIKRKYGDEPFEAMRGK